MVFWVLVALALIARYDLVVADPATTSISLVSITPDPATITYGDEITIVYQIIESPDVSGPPITGEVDLIDTANGNTVIDTIQVDANAGPPVTATYTKKLDAGSYSIQAQYGGDNDHSSSTSSSIEAITITKATTSISLVSITPDPATITYGEGITIVYQIIESPDVSGGPISGEVDLIDTANGNTLIDTIQVDINAGPPVTATYTKTLGAGGYSIQAQYKGDNNHFTSTSTSIESIDIAQDTPTISFTTTPSSTTIKYGQKVTFSALTLGTKNSQLFPNGTIEFKSSTTSDTYCTDNSLINGVGECDKIFSVLGLYNILGSYSGNDNYSGAQSEAKVIHVDKDDPIVTFTYTISPLLPAGSDIGQQLIFTANIAGSQDASFFPSSGKIEFRTSSVVLCTQNSITSVSNGGIGTCQTTSAINPGNYQVFARYYGNSFYNQDDSEKQTITIENIPSSLSLTIHPIPPRNTPFGQPVTFTTIISARYDLNLHPPAAPSGGYSSVIIQGRNNNNQLITLCSTTTISNQGEAICITNTLAVSQYTQIVAYYNGTVDGKWLKSDTSRQSGKTYRVTKALTSIEPIAPVSQTILAGDSVTVRFLIKESVPTPGSPTGTVNLFNTNGGHLLSTQIQINALGQSIASFTVSTLRFGKHNLRARYLGNTNFADSTTIPPHAVVTVNQASPTYVSFTNLNRATLKNLAITHTFTFTFTNANSVNFQTIVFNKRKVFDPFSPFQTKAIQINSDAGVKVVISPKASTTVLGYFNRLPPGTYTFGKPYPVIQSQNAVGSRIVNGLLQVPIGGTFSGVLSWASGVSQISWTGDTKGKRDIIFTFAKPDIRSS